MYEREYWLGFSMCSGIGPVTFAKLLAAFGTAQNAWQAPEEQLRGVLNKKSLPAFLDFRKTFSFDEQVQKLAKKNVWFVTLKDNEYPMLLGSIQKPPFVLYGRGNKEVFYSSREQSESRSSRQARTIIPTVAVVGTRKITSYGRQVTELFVEELVQNDITIVSGLAMGVDAVAHQTTLDHSGKTIAVLGCGVDCCTPGENERLYDEILEKGGTILSELPLGHSPTVGSFPARNRIVAGLSQGVLVTEGAEDSGALITAEYALEEGRKVFAVPGPITSSMSQGPFKLITKGAKLVTSATDLVKELGIKNKELGSEKRIIKGNTIEEQMIIDVLMSEQLYFDELVRRTNLSSQQLGGLLSLLELRGIVQSTEGIFCLVYT